MTSPWDGGSKRPDSSSTSVVAPASSLLRGLSGVLKKGTVQSPKKDEVGGAVQRGDLSPKRDEPASSSTALGMCTITVHFEDGSHAKHLLAPDVSLEVLLRLLAKRRDIAMDRAVFRDAKGSELSLSTEVRALPAALSVWLSVVASPIRMVEEDVALSGAAHSLAASGRIGPIHSNSGSLASPALRLRSSSPRKDEGADSAKPGTNPGTPLAGRAASPRKDEGADSGSVASPALRLRSSSPRKDEGADSAKPGTNPTTPLGRSRTTSITSPRTTSPATSPRSRTTSPTTSPRDLDANSCAPDATAPANVSEESSKVWAGSRGSAATPLLGPKKVGGVFDSAFGVAAAARTSANRASPTGSRAGSGNISPTGTVRGGSGALPSVSSPTPPLKASASDLRQTRGWRSASAVDELPPTLPRHGKAKDSPALGASGNLVFLKSREARSDPSSRTSRDVASAAESNLRSSAVSRPGSGNPQRSGDERQLGVRFMEEDADNTMSYEIPATEEYEDSTAPAVDEYDDMTGLVTSEYVVPSEPVDWSHSMASEYVVPSEHSMASEYVVPSELVDLSHSMASASIAACNAVPAGVRFAARVGEPDFAGSPPPPSMAAPQPPTRPAKEASPSAAAKKAHTPWMRPRLLGRGSERPQLLQALATVLACDETTFNNASQVYSRSRGATAAELYGTLDTDTYIAGSLDNMVASGVGDSSAHVYAALVSLQEEFSSTTGSDVLEALDNLEKFIFSGSGSGDGETDDLTCMMEDVLASHIETTHPSVEPRSAMRHGVEVLRQRVHTVHGANGAGGPRSIVTPNTRPAHSSPRARNAQPPDDGLAIASSPPPPSSFAPPAPNRTPTRAQVTPPLSPSASLANNHTSLPLARK